MTYEEAIDELRKIRQSGAIIPQKRAEALDVAIESIEKQIHKDCVISKHGFFGIYHPSCPRCKRPVTLVKFMPYCDNCGQALVYPKLPKVGDKK